MPPIVSACLPSLPPAASYRAFVEAGTSAQVVAEARAAEEFWVERYASGVPSFELPLDHPRPRLKTYAAAREVARIDEPLYLALRKMSAQQGCTLVRDAARCFPSPARALERQ